MAETLPFHTLTVVGTIGVSFFFIHGYTHHLGKIVKIAAIAVTLPNHRSAKSARYFQHCLKNKCNDGVYLFEFRNFLWSPSPSMTGINYRSLH